MAKQQNHFTQVFYIQEYTISMQKKGVTNKKIIENLQAVYPISERAFYRYLSRNVRKELRAMGVDMDELKKKSESIINHLNSLT